MSQFRLPLSEGQIDKQFAALGVQLYLDAVRKQKLLYTVGIGGYQEAFAQTVDYRGLEDHASCRSIFESFTPSRFSGTSSTCAPRRCAAWCSMRWPPADSAAIAVHAYQAMKSRRPAHVPAVEFSEESGFGTWADEIWEAAKSDYSLIAVRDATILNILYPASDPRWIRLKVTFEGNVVGWAVLLNVPMQDHNYFGNMRVGSLVDCLALPGMEEKVIVAADPPFEISATRKSS